MIPILLCRFCFLAVMYEFDFVALFAHGEQAGTGNKQTTR
jgi:hypothetical protein